MHVSFGMRHAFGKGSSKSEKIRVSELFRHPKFDLRKLKYDVALIKLESPSTKKLAKLPAADGSNNKPGTMATVVGWGLVNNETFAATLKTVDVKILTDEECAKVSGNTATKTTRIGDGKDACEGGAGGPLIANEAVEAS